MDTITHTLFGLTLYGSVDKRGWEKPAKRALLFTAVLGSQAPDIDVVSSLWDTAGRYQMWHRGFTHSVFLVPVWAALLFLLARLLWKRQAGGRLFGMGLLAVFIHDTSDLFNAWGTGYFEPWSPMRVTFGTIPIVDPLFWLIMLAGWLWVRYRLLPKGWPGHLAYRAVWALMALHVGLQSAQGYLLYREAHSHYEQVALSADFVPGQFTVIGKQGSEVVLEKGNVFTGLTERIRLESREDADLERLFAANPKAKTLMEWSPFVVVVDDGQRLGVYDPRFYRNGQSFLFEYIENSAP
ncbi:metal-dependent hydrolase [Gorillibacterium sp. sgz5001074]|uniref:metal-dependent hydrolase n=1 Tax=Gorillibacterium sp. sgz5001074 TaxID=3446695 RepID=UPI003F675F09